MGKKDKRAAKKKPIAEAPPDSSNKRLIENLRTANARLVEETAECRREIERLRIHLESLIAEKDIFHGIKHDVFALVVSSGLPELASRSTSEALTDSNNEKSLKNKIEATATEANAKDIELLALVKEKYEEKELEEFKDGTRSMEQANEQRRRRKNLICSVVFAVSLVAAASAVFLAF